MADPSLSDTQQTIRIPLVNVSDNRMAGGQSGLFLDQQYINCYPMVARHPITGETDFSVNKRVGLSNAGITINALVGSTNFCIPLANMGMSQLSDVCVGAWYEDNTQTIRIVQYRPAAGTVIQIGSIPGATPNDSVYITEIMLTTSFTPGIAVIWCGSNYTSSKGFFAQSAGGVFGAGTLTQIVDVLFPPNLGTPDVLVGPAQQLNGYFYVMGRSGTVYQCANAYNIVAWASRIQNTYSYPDKGTGIFRFKNHLVAFSDTTIEFFNDTGGRTDGASTITSNLERTDQAFIKFGAISAKYVKNIDDILYWISASDTTTLGLWKMDGYTPVKISTKREEQIIASSLSSNGLRGDLTGSLESISLLGQKHLVLNYMHVASATFFNSADGLSWPAASDFYMDAAADGTRRLFSNVMLYDLTTQAWWHWGDCSDIADTSQDNLTGLLPCAYFNRASTNDFYDQFVLKQISGTSLSPISQVIFALQANTGTFYDAGSVVPLFNPKYGIQASIQTNTLDQGILDTKFLRRANVVADTPIVLNNIITPDPYVYLMVARNDVSSALINTSSVKIYPMRNRIININQPAFDLNNGGSTTFNFIAASPTFSKPLSNKMTVEWWGDDSGDTGVYGITIPLYWWKSDNTSSSFYIKYYRGNATTRTIGIGIANAAAEAPGIHEALYNQTVSAVSANLHHYAIVFDGTQAIATNRVTLYIDGVLTPWTSNSITATTLVQSSDNLTFGIRSATSPQSLSANGIISMMRVWNVAKTQYQIKYSMKDVNFNRVDTPNLTWALLDGVNRNIYEQQSPANTLVNLTTLPIDPPLPMFNRLYANNCGPIGRGQYAIFEKSTLPFRAKYLELNLVQGSR